MPTVFLSAAAVTSVVGSMARKPASSRGGRPGLSRALGTELAQAKSQTLLGQRLLEKSKRANGLGSAARLRIGIGGHEDAANAEALADFVSGIDAIARTNQANVHQHHIWALALGDADRLIGRTGNGDHGIDTSIQHAAWVAGQIA